MRYLLDTNIVSEVRKGAQCDPGVAAWWRQVDDSDVHLSVLVVGEIRKGIELIQRRSAESATLVTRNETNVASLGADVLNPFRRSDRRTSAQ